MSGPIFNPFGSGGQVPTAVPPHIIVPGSHNPYELPVGSTVFEQHGLRYEPEKYKHESVATRTKLITAADRDPVVAVEAFELGVVYVRQSGARKAVSRRNAIIRQDEVVNAMFQEISDKPREETDKDVWLIENTLKACARSAEMCGRPFSRQTVERALRRVQQAAKGIYRRGDPSKGAA